MRYRWKLLILLLIISLLPILVMRTLAMRTIRQFRDTLVTQTRENILTSTQNRLQLLADAYSIVLRKERQQIQAALLAQEIQVERLLAEKPFSSPEVYFVKDFDSGRRLPDDVLPSSLHSRYQPSGRLEFLAVSPNHPVFKLAPSVDQESVAADIARLEAMRSTYRKLSRQLETLVLWHSVSLANGLYSEYPGHGGIPRQFDPRKQIWYKNAVAGKGPPWSLPFVDPSTRQIVVSATLPVKSPGGEIAGVTSIVVPISSLLDHQMLFRNISPQTRIFMSFLERRAEDGQMGARIIAHDELTDLRHRNWRSRIEQVWLESDDKERFQALMEDVETGKSNIRRMRFENKDSLWVYGKTSVRAFFVLITPYAEIIKPVQVAQSKVQDRIDRLIGATRLGLGLTVILVVVLAFSFSRTVTKPLWALVEGARQLAEGNFGARVEIRSRDEFGVMGQVFNAVGPQLEESRLMRQSLDVAMEVQRNLLPRHPPQIPGLDIAGKSVYCDQTGGDYYDFIDFPQTGDTRLQVAVGDVAGHGISAALLMTSARAVLRQRAAMPGDIACVLSDANLQLTRDVEESGRFVTMFYSEIDMKNRQLWWVRAGHDPALVYDSIADTFDELIGKGLPLGVTPTAEYNARVQQIIAGQIYVIGTDGIWETRSPAGDMFGKHRFREIIRENAHQPAQKITDAVFDAVSAFRQSVKQEDDITLVIIKIEE
jgi:sigma-B regulation protein RsbU (phosphoserine phosphatase)